MQKNAKNPAIEEKKKGAEKGREMVGGKTSVSKRHSKRVSKVIEDEDEQSEEVITRLQSQPSILKGG